MAPGVAAPVTPVAPNSAGFGSFLTQILSDRDRYFGEVTEGEGLSQKLGHALWTLVCLSALYGAAAGAFAGPVQAIAAAVKLPLLFLGTLAICFPGFFVIQVLVGSRLRFAQVLALVLGALSLSAILLVAVVPVTLFFLFTGANYYFLTLLHVLIVLGAGLVGMVALHDGLAFACEKREVYPKKAMTIMKVWAVEELQRSLVPADPEASRDRPDGIVAARDNRTRACVIRPVLGGHDRTGCRTKS
jgi:hypothetical protein